MAELIVFEHANFRGAHKHLFDSEPNLGAPEDNFFNDKISSFVIISGTWQFFQERDFGGPKSATQLPGLYNHVRILFIPNDTISSIKLISQSPSPKP